MILIYLRGQKLEFRENRYSDKGQRIGTLIEKWPGQWGFYAERSASGLTALMLLAIVAELARLNTRSLQPHDTQDAPEPPLGHIVPEPPTDAL